MLQVQDSTFVQHHRVKWVLAGGQLMDSDWTGGVRLFSGDVPFAKAPEDPNTMFPLQDYQAALKSSEKGIWVSGTHGTVTQAVWLPRPGSLIVACLDGTILQLTANVLEDATLNAVAEAKPTPASKAPSKEATKKPTFSKVVYRHTEAVKHLKWLENPSGAPHLVSASQSGTVAVLDTAGGKFQTLLAPRRFSFSPCSALSTSGTSIAAAFEDGTTQLFDSQFNVTLKLTPNHAEPLTTSLDQNGHLLAMGLLDELALVYDIRKTSEPIHKMATQGAVRSIKICPTKPNFCVTASDDGHVVTWDLSGSSPISTYDFKHADKATSISWSEEAPGEFVSGSFDGLILRHKIPATTTAS